MSVSRASTVTSFDRDYVKVYNSKLLDMLTEDPGGVGCLMSHIEVCKLIVSRGYDRACVIEDDAELDDDFPIFVDVTTQYPNDIDAIKLEAAMKRKFVLCSHVARVAGRNLVSVPGNNTNGAACYIMTRQGASKFVEATLKAGYVAVDHFMFSYRLSSIKSLHVLPYPARQGAVFVSTISQPLAIQLSQPFAAPKKKRRRRTMREVWEIRSRRSKEVFNAFLISRRIIGARMLYLTMARVQTKISARPNRMPSRAEL